MAQAPGPVYGGPVPRRPAPYPNPMYMANKRQQQPGMFHPSINQVSPFDPWQWRLTKVETA